MAREVAEVMGRACARLAQAGVELVEVEIPGLFELDAKVSFQVALHEPIEDIPAYLAASGIEGIGLAEVAAQVASPDVQGAFSAILVYAHELLPGRVGMVSGMFFGFSFGLGGVAAAGLGRLADAYGIVFVYHLTAWLPAIGLLVWFLPDLEKDRFRKAGSVSA